MKRKLFSILILCSLVFTLVSCEKASCKIGLFLYDESDTFISSFSEELTTRLSDSYDISIYDAKKSQSIQNKQIIEMLENEKPNVILVNIVDRLSSIALIQKANKYKTPIIFFNREPVSSSSIDNKNIYYVGTNPVQEGINQGIMAEKLMNNPKNINKLIDKNNDNKLQCVFIQGESTHQDAERRTYSCITYLQSKGYSLDILAMENADWNRSKGEKTMENIYTTYGNKIEFVFSNNDDMALGAIDYLANNNLLQASASKALTPFPIVGVDGTKDGLSYIERKLLYGTTINDTTKQVSAIELVIQLINKQITRDAVNDKFNFYKDSNYIYISGSAITVD